jgi:hypothetical protein
MALTRQQIFDIINTERQYQDNLWPPHDGHKNTEHCLTTVQVYLRKAEDAWISAKDEVSTWQQLAKIAAVITRALEVGNESEALVNGLR